MTKESILEEIRKLPAEEQREIAEALRAPRADEYELTEEEKILAGRRWREIQGHGDHTLSLQELLERVHDDRANNG